MLETRSSIPLPESSQPSRIFGPWRGFPAGCVEVIQVAEGLVVELVEFFQEFVAFSAGGFQVKN